MSNQKCCVPGCVNSSDSNETLHKFPHPLKDKNMFNTWVYSVGGPILSLTNDHIFKYRRVCHIHFEEKYWCQNKRLSNIAIPTKHLPGLSVGKFVGAERSILKPIQNISTEATTSKATTTLQIRSHTGTENLEMKENVEAVVKIDPVSVTPQLLTQDTVKDVQMKDCPEAVVTTDPVSVTPQIPTQDAVKDVQMKDCSEAVVTIDPVSVTPQLLTQDTVKDVQMKDCPEAVVTTDPVSVTPQILTQDTVKDVQMKDCSEAVVTIDPVSVTPQLLTQDTVKDVQMKDCPEAVLEHKKSAAVLQRKRRKCVAVTETEQALYKRLVRVGIKLSKCRNKVKRQAKKIRAIENIATNPQFINTLDNLPSTAKILTLMQFREYKKKNKGQRFTLKEKLVALSIHKQSPKGYRFLRKIFILPSPQTLVKLINMADIRPGINKNTIDQLKKATENMKVEHRLCVVLFDEMSLKPNIAYNERKDKVTGFVTNGVETRLEFADHAQVFMIRGLMKNYKQPVAYTFSQSATKGPELASQLKAVIGSLQSAGLIVVATVCDQGTNNSQCIKILTQEAKSILLRRGQEPRNEIILINDQEIIPLYDPPHLLKCVRNNLITKDLKYKKDGQMKTAKWSHILALHEENPGYKGIRLVPKLTDQHCVPSRIPRMKVKYASQLFSQTVASNMGYLADKGILPAEAKETADVLLFFDKLFDSVNGSYNKKTKHGKPLLAAATPNSKHHQFWQEAKPMLKTMNFVNKISNKNEHVPSLKNWAWTLEGIEVLIKKLKNDYDVSSVWLRHLNQDPIENFFGSIRSHGCRNVNPTPEKFETAFTTLLVNSLSSAHAPGANCEVDNCVALHEAIITGASEKRQDPIVNIPNITITPLEEKNEPRIIGGLQYVSGYFLKKAQQKVFKGCDQCKKDLVNENEMEYLKYREYANKKWLYSPSDSLLDCISSLQDINYEIIKENIDKNNVKELIKTIILMHVEFDYIKCENHKEAIISFLINISCRFFIYNYCKDLNKILSNRRDCDDDEDLLKIKAKKYSMKCFKRKITK